MRRGRFTKQKLWISVPAGSPPLPQSNYWWPLKQPPLIFSIASQPPPPPPSSSSTCRSVALIRKFSHNWFPSWKPVSARRPTTRNRFGSRRRRGRNEAGIDPHGSEAFPESRQTAARSDTWAGCWSSAGSTLRLRSAAGFLIANPIVSGPGTVPFISSNQYTWIWASPFAICVELIFLENRFLLQK